MSLVIKCIGLALELARVDWTGLCACPCYLHELKHFGALVAQRRRPASEVGMEQGRFGVTRDEETDVVGFISIHMCWGGLEWNLN